MHKRVHTPSAGILLIPTGIFRFLVCIWDNMMDVFLHHSSLNREGLLKFLQMTTFIYYFVISMTIFHQIHHNFILRDNRLTQ